MKKKLLSGVTLLFAAAASIAIYSAAQSPTSRLTPAQLKNLEALTQSEKPCDNYSGFRVWTVNGSGPGKKGFYDCCYVYREGWNPSGKCY